MRAEASAYDPIADASEHRLGHRMRNAISTTAKILLVVFTIPLAAIVGLFSWVFGAKEKLSAAEVATYLRNFIEGGGDVWDWDDFTSVPIFDPQLEDIRRRAAAVTLPNKGEAMIILQGLLVEAERLAQGPEN